MSTTPTIKPTKLQGECLAWMVKQGWDVVSLEETATSRRRIQDHISGGSLINYYAERAAALDRHTSGSHGGGYAQHGWRRAGGTMLANLAKRGFVEHVGYTWGVSQYVMTEAGAKAGREILDKEAPAWFTGRS